MWNVLQFLELDRLIELLDRVLETALVQKQFTAA